MADRPTTYIIKPGDTLWDIARAHLGAGKRWPEIYERNREAIGDNPDLIYPGIALVLPPRTGG